MKYAFLLLLAVVSCTDADQTNTQITEPEPLLLTQTDSTGESGYRNGSNELLIPFGKYAQCLTDTFRTHAIVMTKEDHKWVVIDRGEKQLYEVFPFDNGPDYPSEGLFRFVKNGKIGYADATTYAIVIPAQFDCAYPFENGKAKVSKNCKTVVDGENRVWSSDEWQFIDKKGIN
jgi:hypothetical protein